MKKILFTIAFSMSLFSAFAQVEVSTKNFDLESQKKHKQWRFTDAVIDPQNGNVVVSMAKFECDLTSGYNTYTFRGFNWDVDRLVFDSDFNYQETKSKKYPTTEEALVNGENIYGKKFGTLVGNGVAGIALNGLAMPKGLIDNSFMFTYIVASTAAVTGFKIASSYISLKLEGEDTKTKGVICGENPAVFPHTSEDAKEAKGQRWIPMYNNPVPNGGNILFSTVGVIKEDKPHYIFRKYDKSASVIKEITFTFDNQYVLTCKELERAPGQFDYIFIAIPINYKKSKVPLVDANTYEYFYVDGNTYEIKEKLKFTAPNSGWLVTNVLHENGATYLVGACGPKNNVYADIFSFPKVEAYDNFQIAKIENGKLAYIKSTMNKDLKSAFKTTEGLKGNSSVNFAMANSELILRNGKLIWHGQQEYGGVKGALQLIVIDENGKIESIVSKQEKVIARSHISFSKDGKLFWLTESVDKYNEVSPQSTVIPKKAREAVSSLSVLSYNLNKGDILKYQNLENDEWALNFKHPILTDGESKMILLGYRLTKKAKESEIVFITLKK